jgi:hypothetical protein
MRAALYWFCVIGLAAQMRPAPPWIKQGGVVNNASRLPIGLPGGALAPGALISIDGLRFSPGDTAVEVETPKRTLQAKVLDSTTDHILARMPDINESGKAILYAVSKNGRSVGTEIRLSPAAAGIYTSNRLGWGPADGVASGIGGKVSIKVTGLGHATERSIDVFAAGRKAARVRREADDRLSFDLPAGLHGCTIPVAVGVNGIVGNTATVDTAGDCGSSSGQRASVVLMRSDVILEMVEGKQVPFAVDALRAGFDQWSVEGLRTLFAMKPAPGACISWSGQISQEDLVLPGLVEQAVSGAEADRGDPIVEGSQDLKDLDAGSAITITGPAGSATSNKSTHRPQVYAAVLGGNPPMTRIPPRPLFLAPGQYTVGIAGGADLGAMKIPINVPEAARWINRESSSIVRRLDGVRLEWSAPDDYGVLTVIANIDRRDGIAGFAVCQPPAGVSQFRVPPYALANLPLTRRGPSDLSLGFAGVIGIPLHPPVVQTPGKESLSIYFVSLSGRSVVVQ